MMTKRTSTKKILFVAAVSQELKVIKNLYKNQPSWNLKADFLVSWIWNLQTSLNLTKHLSLKKYDFIINIGVCWYKKNNPPLIQIARTLYAPTRKEAIVPIFFKHTLLTSIYCSEVPVYDESLIGEEEYVDMESYSIEKVCEHFRIPRIILKTPSDKIGSETKNFDVKKACKQLDESLDIKSLLDHIQIYLNSLPEKHSLEKYFQHYSFSQSEKIIFEKYFYSYTTLSISKFETFFTENKSLPKKEFLAKLSEGLSYIKQKLW